MKALEKAIDRLSWLRTDLEEAQAGFGRSDEGEIFFDLLADSGAGASFPLHPADLHALAELFNRAVEIVEQVEAAN